MKKPFKKITALLLSALMTVGSGTVAASATEQEQEYSEAEAHYREVLNAAKAVDPDDYSADSYAKFTDRVSKYDVSLVWTFMPGKVIASDHDYNMKSIGIESAYRLLDTNKEQSNYKDLEEIINTCDNINKDDYTEESYEHFQSTLTMLKNDRNSRYTLETAAELEKSGNSPRIYTYIISEYERALSYLEKKDSVNVVKTDNATGAEVSYNNTYISSDLDFVVNEYNSDNWDWVTLDVATDLKVAPSICSNYGYYEFSLFNKDGSRAEITDEYTVTLPIPEKFENAEKISVSLFKNNCGKGAIASVDTDVENRMITIHFNNYSWLYSANGAGIYIGEAINAIDPATLEDGVYYVQANLTHAGDVTRTSMANGTVVHKALLTKNGDDINIYIDFVPIYVFGPDAPSYTGGLWCESGDNKSGDNVYDKSSQTILSYYTNDDGSLCDNEIYNGVTEVSTPKTIKLHLNRDCFQTDNYLLTVMSPAMAAISNMTYDELNEKWDDLNVRLKLSEPELYCGIEYADGVVPKYDKSALRYEIDYSLSLDEYEYTTESWNKLLNAIETAKAKYNDESTSVEEIAEQIRILQEERNALVVDGSGVGDTTELAALVETAKAINEDEYTADSFNALQNAVASAEAALKKENIKQSKLDEQVAALQNAIDSLEKKALPGLDKNALADGEYVLDGKMVKPDRDSLSMSDSAIDHKIKLSVKNGEYFITMNFKGLTIGALKGYLKDLKYYESGYTCNAYGYPKGSLAEVTVNSYINDENGERIVDTYGTDYPESMTFPLISEALQDDFVPLQVFVPIMDAIQPGSGEQPVFLKLDWSSLEKCDESLAEGTYNLSVKAITASTYGSDEEKEFALSRQFDPNIKLTVDGDSKMKLSLLYKPSKIDMKKLAIDDVEGVKTEYGKDATGTAYEFTMDIADITSDHKLSFSYDTGIPTLGDNGVMTHSVYLKDYQTSDWNGYDWKPGLAEGTYNLSVKAITASTYGSDEEKEFALSRQFDPNIKLTVDGDGKMKLSLLYKPSKIDMKKLSIDDVEGVKTEYGKDATGTAYEFTMDIADITSDHKLSFSYDTGVPTLGDNGVMTHSVYLKDYQTSDWNGYDWNPARLIGDVNGDSVVDILDATLIQKVSVDKETLNDEQKAVADVNNDGIVDILDATDIQKYAVDKITEFKKKA